jgi:hypothetical protein
MRVNTAAFVVKQKPFIISFYECHYYAKFLCVLFILCVGVLYL